MSTAFSRFNNLIRQVHPWVLTSMVIAVVGMNLLANKSIDTGVPWLALDCGILLSWLAFLAMDVAVHCYGPHAATATSLTALAINLVIALVFFVASRVPGVWGESFVETGGDAINAALDNTFGGTWFIILGSSIAFAAAAFFNIYLNAAIGRRLSHDTGVGAFALRSYVSTFVAQVSDNRVFALLESQVF
ncbi:MAG: VUT family protein, partial [Atopobiaceae bacterium]|nr:VUT family protein [Atopobiaceae bacterium]